MQRRRWVALCGAVCALAAIPGGTRADSPPTTSLWAAFSHVTSYVGTVSGNADKTGPDDFTMHFQTQQMVLTRLTPPTSTGPQIMFEGSAPLSTTAAGHCGSGSGSGTYKVFLVIDTTYPMYTIRGDGATDVTYPSCRNSDNSGVSKNYTERLMKDLFAQQFLWSSHGWSRRLRAAAMGVCATQSRHSAGEGWSEIDYYSFKFTSIMNDVGSIQPTCTVIAGDK